MHRGILLAVSIATAATLGVPAHAASANVAVTRTRTYTLTSGSGFERIEVSLSHQRGGAYAGTSTGGVMTESVYACVYAWTKSTFVYACGNVPVTSVAVADDAATGRIKFTLRSYFRDDTAVVDLKLTDKAGSAAPSYYIDPVAGTGYVHSAASGSVRRSATVTGSVKVTTVRQRRVERKTVSVNTEMAVNDYVRLTGSARA